MVGAARKISVYGRSSAKNLCAPVGEARKIFADFSLVSVLVGAAHRDFIAPILPVHLKRPGKFFIGQCASRSSAQRFGAPILLF